MNRWGPGLGGLAIGVLVGALIWTARDEPIVLGPAGEGRALGAEAPRAPERDVPLSGTHAAGNPWGTPRAPRWAPDGHGLAWVAERDDGADLITAHMNGLKPSSVGPCEVPYRGRVGAPTWHPKGLVIFPAREDHGRRLFFGYPGMAWAMELLPNAVAPGDLFDPAAAADVVVFARTDASGVDLYAWKRTEDVVRELTDAPQADVAPDLAPDGRRVAWARRVAGGTRLLWRDLEDGGEHLIADLPGAPDAVPTWVDAQHVAWFAAGRLVVAGLDGSERALRARSPDAGRPGVLRGSRPRIAYTRDEAVMVAGLGDAPPIAFYPPQPHPADPALGRAGNRVLLAYTAEVAPGRRDVFVADVTDPLRGTDPGPSSTP